MTTKIMNSAGGHLYFPEDRMDVIDFEPLEGRELVAAKCGHVFAKATIQDNWMGIWNKTECPVCNQPLSNLKVVKLPEPVPPPSPVPTPVVVPVPAATIQVENSPKKVETITKVSNIFHSVVKAMIPLTLVAMVIGLFICQIISLFSKKK